jgi:trehalose 6-phosphate synthase
MTRTDGGPEVAGKPEPTSRGAPGGRADAMARLPTGFLLVSNRLPVAREAAISEPGAWRRSPGGLLSALEPAMHVAGGAWLGWPGPLDVAPQPFEADGLMVIPVPLTVDEVAAAFSGFSEATLWPLYHDVIVPPQFHRLWWNGYVTVNQRFALLADENTERGATVWIHDYQLLLVPGMLRQRRPDLRIGFFHHIPFPGYEIFAQLPWRRHVVEGLLGADLIGFQSTADVANFLRACRRAAGLIPKGDIVRTTRRPRSGPPSAGRVSASGSVGGSRGRPSRVGAFPVSVDTAVLDELARAERVQARARRFRTELGAPRTVLLAVDRLDYTQGIINRLKAYEELLDAGELRPPDTVLVMVAPPSSERLGEYRILSDEVARMVSRINGRYSSVGWTAVHYVQQSYSQEEMAALYVAADVMLVTPLRDGMNLVAKEYIACRTAETGALVLSEFTGAAEELGSAFIVNPHDLDGLKDAVLRAVQVPAAEERRRMRSLRRRVRVHDIHRWTASYLDALRATASATS